MIRGKSDWIAALENQKAVYLLTDKNNGKMYVGSATSDYGMLLQRWSSYIDNGYGGKKPYKLEPAIDPVKTKLSTLKLSTGEVLTMEYDYGAGWEFWIELISITEMKRGGGTHYPYVIDGKGKGILEDTSPYELLETIKHTDQTGEVPRTVEMFLAKKSHGITEVLI